MKNFKATRMELLNLKKRLSTARRGYKLLKEKRDGLMQELMLLIKELQEKRSLLEKEFSDWFREFLFSSAPFPQNELEEIFSAPFLEVDLKVTQENIMSVSIPKFTLLLKKKPIPYSDISIPISLRNNIEKLEEIFQKMITLAQDEHSARLLALEIEKTRRRVNALEFFVIPKIQSDIKYISSKLEENERSEKIIRMKIKEMID